MLLLMVSACSTLPATVNQSNVNNLNDFELCRAYLSTDLTYNQKRSNGLEHEFSSRGFTPKSCFEVLVDAHGISSICSRAVAAYNRGSGTFLVGFATDLSVSDTFALSEMIGVDCSIYASNTSSGQSGSNSSSSDAVDSVLDAFNKAFIPPSGQPNVERPRSYDYSSPSSDNYTCRTRVDGSVSCSGGSSNVVCRERADGSVRCTTR